MKAKNNSVHVFYPLLACKDPPYCLSVKKYGNRQKTFQGSIFFVKVFVGQEGFLFYP